MIGIASVRGWITVQDAGRPGHMHDGVPPGGALVPEWLAHANAVVGNAPGCAALECFGGCTLRALDEDLLLAVHGTAKSLRSGEAVTVLPSERGEVHYIGVHGGIDVPVMLGGRGWLAVAGLGGFEGRAIRRGDRLPVGKAYKSHPTALEVPRFDDAPVRILLGPDRDRFAPTAYERLVSSPYTVLPASDRMGTRLEGTPLQRRDQDDGLSMPMVRGAIQVPSSGSPVVLGPDHPTTGGYPVIATVIRADWGKLAACPARSSVRFAAVTIEQARAALERHRRISDDP